MFLAEPPPSRYDLKFVLAGVPVRIHPFFWLMAIFSGISGPVDAVVLLTWVAVVFISILVHEFGHVLAMRYYGTPAHVVLYGMGGLAISQRKTYRGGWPQVIVSFAGPAAGFLLALGVVGFVQASGHRLDFYIFDLNLPIGFDHASELGLRMRSVVYDLLQVNIVWGVLNLFPVFPLDGGQISRELLTMSNPGEGLRRSLIVSAVAGISLAVVGAVKFENFFMAFLFGYLAYLSYTEWQNISRGGYGRWQ